MIATSRTEYEARNAGDRKCEGFSLDGPAVERPRILEVSVYATGDEVRIEVARGSHTGHENRKEVSEELNDKNKRSRLKVHHSGHA